jgi:NAD(P)-dependent dehydrogenase (short-subunit alcohol dehydrogenase family)
MTAGVKSKYDDMIFNKDLTPVKRWGKPQDVALAVVAIAEGRFSFSTGLIIDVDGGYHIRRL